MDRCLLKDILLEPKVQMQTLPSVQPSLYHTSYANEQVQEIQYYIHLTRELHIKMILFHKLFYIFTYDAQVRNGYARDTWLWQGHGFYAKVKDTRHLKFPCNMDMYISILVQMVKVKISNNLLSYVRIREYSLAGKQLRMASPMKPDSIVLK